LILPFVVLLWASLLPSLKLPSAESIAMLSTTAYASVWTNLGWSVIVNTIVLVITAASLVVFLATMISWVVIRSRMRGRLLLDATAMLPHAFPGIGFAFALLLIGIMAVRSAPWLPFYATLVPIILANVVHRLAYATRATNAAFLQISSELEEAAQLSGAGRLRTIWQVVVPLAAPSLMFTALWSGLLIFQEVGMALMLSSPTTAVMSTRVWYLWNSGGRINDAAAVGVVMVVIMAVLFLAVQRLVRGQVHLRA
jgi:iron(III) transport system permease protein